VSLANDLDFQLATTLRFLPSATSVLGRTSSEIPLVIPSRRLFIPSLSSAGYELLFWFAFDLAEEAAALKPILRHQPPRGTHNRRNGETTS